MHPTRPLSSGSAQSSPGSCWSRRWFNNKTCPADVKDNKDHSQRFQDQGLSSSSPVLYNTSALDGNQNSGPLRNLNLNNNNAERDVADSGRGRGVSHSATFRNNSRMDLDDELDYVQLVPYESYDFSRSKQRASIKWLLSKAYNNQTPEELAEPFYKDHEGEEHLKPFVVKGLSDAELYCLALSNLYADPNYSQLSPFGVVQALARKGVYVQQSTDLQITETVLIQNRPLRINAHMAVIEAMMVLHVRELISTDRIVNTVQRYGPVVHPREMPSDTEEALLLWINRAVLAIKEYIQTNNSREHKLSSSQVESWNHLPLFQDLSDLSDGVGLSALLAFYCQDEVSLTEITVPNPAEPLNVSESLWNLQLLQRVCRDSLPFNVCHFSLEDILYLHESMKQNVFSFMADLFNQVELNPAPVVKILGSHLQHVSARLEKNAMRSQSATSTPKKMNTVQIHERPRKSATNIYLGDASSGRRSPSSASVVSVPVRRSGTPQDYHEKALSERSNHKDQRYYANSSEDSEEFVVHRGRNVPTLSQVIRSVSPSSQDERSSPASRMSTSRNISMNNDSGDDSGIPAAGRPSNLGANKTSYAGRRSRRNSFTEADSQLTVENFGGSQDNLNRLVMGKNPDKEPSVFTDTTVSPVRYPKRNSSVEPPDLYNQQQQSQPHEREPAGTRSVRSQSRERTTSEDLRGEPFYGKKKLNYTLESNENYSPNHQQQQQQQRSQNVSEDPYTSGNFYQQQQSQEPLQPQFHTQRVPQPQQSYQQQSRQPQDSNVTVYVMNNDGNFGGLGDPPMRSTSMTNLSRLSDVPNKPVNIVYLQNPPSNGSGGTPSYSSNNGYGDRGGPYQSQEYHSQVATLPSSSSGRPYSSPAAASSRPRHQQEEQYRSQQSQYSQPRSGRERSYSPEQEPHHRPHYQSQSSEDFDTDDLAAQLAAIRQKLEDKRKRIELEKGRMETIASKNQFKLGKAAYLKAINKDLESKWLNKTDDQCRTPEIENMDTETYQKSLAKMDTNLSELESDISRLSLQQEQIHKVKNQFFLHGDSNPGSDSDTAKRKTWTVPSGGTGSGRSQWGPPKPYNTDTSSQEPQRPSLYNGGSRPQNNLQSNPIPVNSFSGTNGSGSGAGSFRLHSNADSQGNRLFSRPGGSDAGSSGQDGEGERPTPPPRQKSSSSVNIHHAPLPTPPPDDMEPQSVCFVQDDNPPSDPVSLASSSKKSLQITSGSKTYRITPESGSPPRPSAHRLFNSDVTEPSSDENASLGERGFYIPMDNEVPKRPKPPLRTKARRADTENLRNSASAPGRRDMSSEYISSIVDRVPIPSPDDDDDNEFQVQKYSHRQSSVEEERGGGGGELVIDEKHHFDSDELDLMEKKKEKILLLSLKRQQAAEEQRRLKEYALQRRKEEEAAKAEEKERRKEEDKARKQAILESYRMKKQDDQDKDSRGFEVQDNSAKRFMRPKSGQPGGPRPRPKTIHLSEVDSGANSYGQRVGSGVLRRSDSQSSGTGLGRSYGKRGSSGTLYSGGTSSGIDSRGASQSRRDPWGSTSSLNQDNSRRALSSSYDRDRRARSRPREASTSRLEVRSRRDSYGMGSTDYLPRGSSTSSLLDGCDASSDQGGQGQPDSDSGVGTCSPPTGRKSPPNSLALPSLQRPIRLVSSATTRQIPPPSCSLPSPSSQPSKPWPGSLPPGLISRRGRFDDGASDISSVNSSNMDYSGLRLYKQPTAKSNRSIILNAVEYCVFPGVVNLDAKMRVLDEVNRSEGKHFLIMFRDAGCQFRALYTYVPERDEIVKLYGTGPKTVNDAMFEKFFKYNSGGKCFSQVHTKHLTVTIDAFTIHNALWIGKKAPVSKTKDMALVI